MASVYHFLAGGAANGQYNALDETVQVVFEEIAEGRRKLKYASFHNNSATTAAHVKLFWERQRQNMTFGGTIGDGDYVTTFAHPSLSTSVSVTTTRTGGTPADAAALAVQHEADIEAEAGLSALIASADDDGAGTNNILTTRGVRDLVITTTPPGSATMTVDNTVVPILASDLPDTHIPIPAGQTVAVYLGDKGVVRLYAAATQESGVGGTAPNEDITGFIVVD